MASEHKRTRRMDGEPVPDIFDLWRKVQAHPDYVFGTIFVPGDFPNEEVPEDFPANRATDALAERGNLYIIDTVGEPEDDPEYDCPECAVHGTVEDGTFTVSNLNYAVVEQRGNILRCETCGTYFSKEDG